VYNQAILQAGPQLKGTFDYTIRQVNGQFMDKGKLVLEQGQQTHLMLSNKINAGTYILTVSNTQKVYSFKIIKM
jgi:hypothetical protein